MTRLSAVGGLPTGWITVPEVPTPSPNTSCILQQHPLSLTPSFTFTIAVDTQLKWKLTVCSAEVNVSSYDVLSQVPPVCSVEAVVKLVSLLESSKLTELPAHNKGHLKDQHVCV